MGEVVEFKKSTMQRDREMVLERMRGMQVMPETEESRNDPRRPCAYRPEQKEPA